MPQEPTRRKVGLAAIRQTSATIAVVKALVGEWMDGKAILWVDDHPENNTIIRKVFGEAGACVSLAQSTEEAMGVLRGTDRATDLVISDMGRADDPVAGLTLFALMCLSGIAVPRIIYSDSPLAREKSEEISELNDGIRIGCAA